MLCHIQYLSNASVRLMHTPDDTIQIEPPKIDGKDPFQDRRKEKRRQGDIPFTMFYMTFLAVLTLLGNLLADILYAVADPRVRIN